MLNDMPGPGSKARCSHNESIESYYYRDGDDHEFSSETGSPTVETYYAGEDGH